MKYKKATSARGLWSWLFGHGYSGAGGTGWLNSGRLGRISAEIWRSAARRGSSFCVCAIN